MKQASVFLMSVLMAFLIMSCEKDEVLLAQDEAMQATELRTDSPATPHRPAWRFTTNEMKGYITDMVEEGVLFGKHGSFLVIRVRQIEERIADDAILSAKKAIRVFENDVELMVERQYMPDSYAKPLYRMAGDLVFILDGKLTVFRDDFESYKTGAFPFEGGWDIYFEGNGQQYQAVSDAIAASGSKSLRLEGRLGWSATAFKAIDNVPEVIFVEAKILLHKPVANNNVDLPKAGFGLINMEEGLWGTRYAYITFDPDGHIYFDAFRVKPERIGDWRAETWHNFRIKYNKLTKMASIWRNDKLVKEHVNLQAPEGTYAGVILDSGRDARTTTFFDDVMAWKLVP